MVIPLNIKLMKYITILMVFLIGLGCDTVREKTEIDRNHTHNLEFILREIRNPNDKCLVSAHRGDWRNAPENSLMAIRNCIDMGTDIVEIDIRKTKDGHLILMHDETLDRTTTGSGPVEGYTLREVRKLYLRNGPSTVTRYRVPTLQEALETASDKILLYLDKSMEYMPEVLNLLQETRMWDNVIFMHPIDYKEAKTMFGDLLSKVNLIARMEATIKDSKAFIAEYAANNASPLAFQLRLSDEEKGQSAYMDHILQKEIHICVSTLWSKFSAGHDDNQALDNPNQHWGWHVQKGVSIFNTDRPKALLQYLRTQGLHD